jgi:CheY-like chemotaxis protein
MAALEECVNQLAGISVLLVDDEVEQTELTALVLEEAGARVFAVTSGSAATRLLPTFRPSVLLSDIAMPSETGYELIRRIRRLEAERGGRIAAVALTANVTAEDRQAADEAGFDAYLAKPVDPTLLIEVVRSLAGRSAAREPV